MLQMLWQSLTQGFVHGQNMNTATSQHGKSQCRYSGKVQDYNKAYETAKAAIISKFYGAPKKGVYSPSVQYTLYQMALEIFAKWALLLNILVPADAECKILCIRQLK